MKPTNRFVPLRKSRVIGCLVIGCAVLMFWHLYAYGQDKSDFPDGYDAVQAAPKSHKVIFENALVRVLEVTEPVGSTVPMHHHRWPSFFLSWDTGGPTPHVRYRRGDGSVRDTPSHDEPVHAGRWAVQWMNPEPMHEVEIVERPGKSDKELARIPDLRIEIKCRP